MPEGSLVAARFASYVPLLIVAGLPLHAVAGHRRRLGRRHRAFLAATATSALIASLWWALANVAAMAGLSIGDLDQATFTAVLGATPLGSLLLVRCAMLASLLAFLAFRPASLPIALTGACALASTAWAGHAGAGEGPAGLALRVGDILHLLAAALWLGALLSFLGSLAGQRKEADTIRSLSEFARIGTMIVATLLVTGALNAWLISAGQMPGGLWPVLIGIKAALFFAMLGFAARNRWQLVPDFAQGQPGAARRLRCSLALETACAVVIVAVVALAGQLDPHGG